MKNIKTFGGFTKLVNEKKGLWDNVHAKRKRGEKAAKKGDDDYPDEEAWKAAQESVIEASDKDKPYFDFLLALRDSGATNMFGAAPYLQKEFGMSRSEARKILAEWMKSF